METTDNAIIKLKIVTFISIIAFTSSLVFSLTTIYNKFLYMENEIEILKETVIQNDDNQTRRLDNKTDRNSKRIKELEKSGSDNK